MKTTFEKVLDIAGFISLIIIIPFLTMVTFPECSRHTVLKRQIVEQSTILMESVPDSVKCLDIRTSEEWKVLDSLQNRLVKRKYITFMADYRQDNKPT